MAVDYLSTLKPVEKNENYDPIRHGPPVLREMSDERRAALIRQNPDYGIIICRCEEVSKGEILDALRSPIPVPTVDGIKSGCGPAWAAARAGSARRWSLRSSPNTWTAHWRRSENPLSKRSSPMAKPNDEGGRKHAYR